MKTNTFTFLLILFFLVSQGIHAQEASEQKFQRITSNIEGRGIELVVEFHKGIQHYYPLMAIWIEDMEGNYIQSLYVAESIAKGVFEHGQVEEGHWVKGEKRIPAALPYWSHKRGVKSEDSLYIPTSENPLPDAYTGATPTKSFILNTRTDEKLENQFRVLFEINQSWDWNEYWYNSKYPGNREYLKSAQPALVYEAKVNPDNDREKYQMKPIGHSHPYGASGELFEDLSTLTTAKQIAEQIVVKIK